jgi:putative tryptophan/tyrosine transport system permease protein
MTWLGPFEIGAVMGLLLCLAVMGLAVSFNLLDFPDITMEGSLPLGATVFAASVKSGMPVLVALLCAMLAGATAGALTAFIHSRFGINKFLAGILVVAISYTLCLRILGTSNIGLLGSPSLFDYVEPTDRHAPSAALGTALLLASIALAVGALVLWLAQTRGGLRARVAGTNPVYARSLGISVPLHLVAGLAITNAMAAAAGALLAMHQGFADVGMGQGALILCLASMAIGARLVPERKLPVHVFVVVSAALGSVVYQVLVAFAVRLGLSPVDLKLATALLVLTVVVARARGDGSPAVGRA